MKNTLMILMLVFVSVACSKSTSADPSINESVSTAEELPNQNYKMVGHRGLASGYSTTPYGPLSIVSHYFFHDDKTYEIVRVLKYANNPSVTYKRIENGTFRVYGDSIDMVAESSTCPVEHPVTMHISYLTTSQTQLQWYVDNTLKYLWFGFVEADSTNYGIAGTIDSDCSQLFNP